MLQKKKGKPMNLNLEAPIVNPAPAAYGNISCEIIPLADLAKQLDVHVRTLHRWHLKRIGPPRVSIGRQIFYTRSGLLKWLDRNEGC